MHFTAVAIMQHRALCWPLRCFCRSDKQCFQFPCIQHLAFFCYIYFDCFNIHFSCVQPLCSCLLASSQSHSLLTLVLFQLCIQLTCTEIISIRNNWGLFISEAWEQVLAERCYISLMPLRKATTAGLMPLRTKIKQYTPYVPKYLTP